MNPQFPPAPKAQRTMVELLGRTFLHAGVLWVLVTVLDPLVDDLPLGQVVLPFISPGHYAPFSIGMAAGVHKDRFVFALAVVALTFLYWPNDLIPFLLPMLVGTGMGLAVRSGLEAPRA